MNITDRIKISSQHTSNSVFRTIETQEQLERFRNLEGYDITVMPTIHSSSNACISCEG